MAPLWLQMREPSVSLQTLFCTTQNSLPEFMDFSYFFGSKDHFGGTLPRTNIESPGRLPQMGPSPPKGSCWSGGGSTNSLGTLFRPVRSLGSESLDHPKREPADRTACGSGRWVLAGVHGSLDNKLILFPLLWMVAKSIWGQN